MARDGCAPRGIVAQITAGGNSNLRGAEEGVAERRVLQCKVSYKMQKHS